MCWISISGVGKLVGNWVSICCKVIGLLVEVLIVISWQVLCFGVVEVDVGVGDVLVLICVFVLMLEDDVGVWLDEVVEGSGGRLIE